MRSTGSNKLKRGIIKRLKLNISNVASCPYLSGPIKRKHNRLSNKVRIGYIFKLLKEAAK